MAQLTDEEFEAATRRGEERSRSEPRAVGARFDGESARVIVELANGCIYIFPAEMAEELHGAGPMDLAEIEIDGAGFNLRWPRLDGDLHSPATVAGVFDTKVWTARQWASEAGRISTSAKVAASRANGAKGGRPRKRTE